MVRCDLTASTRVTGSFEVAGLNVTDPCYVAEWGETTGLPSFYVAQE